MVGFNLISDSLFAQLVHDNRLIPTRSVFANFTPSILNFTRSCWATADWAAISESSTDPGDSFLQPKKSQIESWLAPTIVEASLQEYAQLWSALSLLNNATGGNTLSQAILSCNNSQALATPPAKPDFTLDCSQTGEFYSYDYSDTSLDFHEKGPDKPSAYDGVVALLRASLPQPYNGFSNSTIHAIALTTLLSQPEVQAYLSRGLGGGFGDISAGQGYGVALLRSPYKEMMQSAAATCSMTACQSLGFAGNADIGGIGALISYISIAALSTLLVVAALLPGKPLGVLEEKKTTKQKIYRNLIKTASMFWEALTWLTILVTIATTVQLWNWNVRVQTRTLYEFALSQYVTFILFNSVSVLTVIFLAGSSSVSQVLNRRTAPGLLALAASGTLTCALSFQFANGGGFNTHWISFETICYADEVWPLNQALFVVSWLEGALPILFGILAAFLLLNWMYPGVFARFGGPRGGTTVVSERFYEAIPILYYFILILSLALLWFDVASMIMLREKARIYFGPSYEDNTAAYGQILASGFIAQPFFIFSVTLVEDLGFSQSWRELLGVLKRSQEKRRRVLDAISEFRQQGKALGSVLMPQVPNPLPHRR